MRDRGGDPSRFDASVVVKVLVSRLVAGRGEAGSEGVEPPVVGFGNRDTAVARAQVEIARMTLCAIAGEAPASSARSAAPYKRTTGLPVSAESRRPGSIS
jgi:hypothetical protein